MAIFGLQNSMPSPLDALMGGGAPGAGEGLASGLGVSVPGSAVGVADQKAGKEFQAVFANFTKLLSGNTTFNNTLNSNLSPSDLLTAHQELAGQLAGNGSPVSDALEDLDLSQLTANLTAGLGTQTPEETEGEQSLLQSSDALALGVMASLMVQVAPPPSVEMESPAPDTLTEGDLTVDLATDLTSDAASNLTADKVADYSLTTTLDKTVFDWQLQAQFNSTFNTSANTSASNDFKEPVETSDLLLKQTDSGFSDALANLATGSVVTPALHSNLELPTPAVSSTVTAPVTTETSVALPTALPVELPLETTSTAFEASLTQALNPESMLPPGLMQGGSALRLKENVFSSQNNLMASGSVNPQDNTLSAATTEFAETLLEPLLKPFELNAAVAQSGMQTASVGLENTTLNNTADDTTALNNDLQFDAALSLSLQAESSDTGGFGGDAQSEGFHDSLNNADTLLDTTTNVAASFNVNTASNTSHANAINALPKGALTQQLQDPTVNAIRTGANEVTLQLNPENLGQVRVILSSQTDGVLQARFILQNADTQNLLTQEMGDLRQALEDQGVKLGQIHIVVAGQAERDHQARTVNSAETSQWNQQEQNQNQTANQQNNSSFSQQSAMQANVNDGQRNAQGLPRANGYSSNPNSNLEVNLSESAETRLATHNENGRLSLLA